MISVRVREESTDWVALAAFLSMALAAVLIVG
jgi:hypothetical protein